MSELKKAKQRIMMKGAQLERQEEDFKQKSFQRFPHSQSIPKFQRRGLTMQERYSEMQQLSLNELEDEFTQYSPKFSKTGRIMSRNKDEDIFGNKSERINLFQKEPSRQRRSTQYVKMTDLRSNIGSEFPQKQISVYNESPVKSVKNTVHHSTLSLVISNPPVRSCYSPIKPKECDKDYMEESIKAEKSNNNNYTDVMFPPRSSVIFNKKYMYLEEGLKFERISRIYQGSKAKLIKFCEPALVVSGKFTSPAVYSALTILAEDPARILGLIGSQQHNQTGIYYVNLCQDGTWRYIIIDDYFPVKILLKRSLLFAHTVPKDNTYQFWGAILEKALAKVYGTYQDLFLTAERGVEPILRALTGFPVSIYLLNKDFRAFLVLIDAAIKKKQIVVLQSIPEQLRETGHLKKLQIFQSYQIIQVKKTYVIVRNLAEKQLCTKLTFEEVMIFQRLLIFRNETNYFYTSYKLRHRKKYYSVLKVTVPQRTRCYWEVWQKNQAYYKNHIGSSIEYLPSQYQIVIKAEASEDQTYDSIGQETVVTESGREVEMKKGVSWVYIHVCQPNELDFVVSYYGEADVKLERVKNQEQWQLECSCQQ